MYSTPLLLLLQQGLSIGVIIAAVLVLLLAIGLVVYFSKRVKKTEKEADENWSHSMHSIFVDTQPRVQAPPPDEQAETVEPAWPARETHDLSAEAFAEEAEPAREFAQKFEPQPEPETLNPPEQVSEPVRETLPLNQIPEPEVAQSEPQPEKREPVPYSETRPLVKEPVIIEAAILEDKVWADLEAGRQERAKQTRALTSEPAAEPPAEIVPPISEQPAEIIEAARPAHDEDEADARVIRQSGRERFVAPRIDPLGQRERFVPPRIEPLTPREQSDFVERRSQTIPLHSKSFDAPPARTQEPAAHAAQSIDIAAQPARESKLGHKRVAGSILGIASEAPAGPLVLGEPVRPAEEAGISGLSRYGKAPDERAGRAGTIALLLIVLVVAGAIGAYYAIPAFKGWVDRQMAYYSGAQAEADRRAALEPKAKILPNRIETIKGTNRNIAGGSVENISGNPLEAVAIELSLEREAGAPAEMITVPVTPANLAAGEVGTYSLEFERDPKYPAAVKVIRLMSNGNEVIFRYPGQNQQ
jgi:flagellar basal body-associated protein FliL